jgi:hypothetical protein
MALNNTLIYDPRYQTFESWACLMVELYAAQQLEIPDSTTDWKLWGNGLGAIDVFTNEALPRTEEFENWFDWAAALVNAVNPAPQALEES